MLATAQTTTRTRSNVLPFTAAKKPAASSKAAKAARAKKNVLAAARKIQRTRELCLQLHAIRPELYRHALFLSHSPATADDLVQDTIERAIRFQDTFQNGTNVHGWAHRILQNVFFSRCRRQRVERTTLTALGRVVASFTPQQGPEMTVLSPPVARAMAALPAQFRAAVQLVDIQEMAYKDAARRMGVPVGTLMSRLHRGRTMLADFILGVLPIPCAA